MQRVICLGSYNVTNYFSLIAVCQTPLSEPRISSYQLVGSSIQRYTSSTEASRIRQLICPELNHSGTSVGHEALIFPCFRATLARARLVRAMEKGIAEKKISVMVDG
jgi:hypothetical protein